MVESPNNTPAWLRLRSELAPTDRPHHVANRVLKALGVTTRAPVDVHSVARRLDVEIKEVPEPGWAGAVASTDRSAVIWLRASDATVRKRFTVAHELGHLFLHPLGREFRDVTFKGGRRESDANQFAADLLIPLWMLDGYVASSAGNVAALAKTFRVSAHAMQIQLSKLAGDRVRW